MLSLTFGIIKKKKKDDMNIERRVLLDKRKRVKERMKGGLQGNGYDQMLHKITH